MLQGQRQRPAASAIIRHLFLLCSQSRNDGRRLQAACKPGSVPGPKAGGWPFLWDPRRRGPRATDPDDRPGNRPAPDTLAGIGAVVPTWSCSRWGLPCRRRRRRRGAPLPHPFTLTRRLAEAGPGGRSALCGTFPGVAPAGRYPAPCLRGARTFLPRLKGGSGHPAACSHSLGSPRLVGSQARNRKRHAHGRRVQLAVAARRPPAPLERAQGRSDRDTLCLAGIADLRQG